ncbi:MAG: glutamate--tRNA ligase [Deltaproteobacteria bacterium]|nr:glutamate--tRNA ligase [Deltaproteobacteria bacterium]
MSFRCRFAPSPTGHLHIGGARTALFNWLLARKNKGTFLLRIEDTDRERSTEEYIHSIVEGLRWLGLDWDEGPYHQMERMEIYKEHIERLFKQSRAYRCYCTAAELEERRKALLAKGLKPKYDGRCQNADQNQKKPYCIRFVTERSGETVVNDLIKGTVTFQNEELDDLVIQRTDGTPTYNLCVVVDDVTMKISHLIRGDDHLNNTPRQIQLYKVFGYTPPQFGHLPMILGPDKSRLSKRHGATSVLEYKEQGYLPEALINFLVRLGWAHGDQEIFTREEMVENFSIEAVGKSGGVFNSEKLLWLNSHYIKIKTNGELLTLSRPFLEKAGFTVKETDQSCHAVGSVKEKVKLLSEIPAAVGFFFRDEIVIEQKAGEKFLTEDNRKLLQRLLQPLTSLKDFTEESIKPVFEGILAETGKKLGDLAQPVRVALTGGTVSPGIFELMGILGKQKTLARLEKAIHDAP